MFRIRTFFAGPSYDACIFFFFLMSMLLSDDALLDGLGISLYIVGMNDSICVHRISLGVIHLSSSLAVVSCNNPPIPQFRMFRTFGATDWAVGCWAANGGTSKRDTGLDPSWPTRCV